MYYCCKLSLLHTKFTTILKKVRTQYEQHMHVSRNRLYVRVLDTTSHDYLIILKMKSQKDWPSYSALNPAEPMVSSDCRCNHIWLDKLTMRSGTLDPVSLRKRCEVFPSPELHWKNQLHSWWNSQIKETSNGVANCWIKMTQIYKYLLPMQMWKVQVTVQQKVQRYYDSEKNTEGKMGIHFHSLAKGSN